MDRNVLLPKPFQTCAFKGTRSSVADETCDGNRGIKGRKGTLRRQMFCNKIKGK